MYDNEEETVNDELQYEHKLKVILIGEPLVGKTCLLSKYIRDVFPKNPDSTIALEYCTKRITLKDSSRLNLTLCDTAGREKYRSIVSRKSIGALLVYDITERETFDKLKITLEEFREKAEPDCAIFLVGNKYDLVFDNPDLRQVSTEEAKEWASNEKMHFIETSAKLGYKVVEVFELLAECKHYIPFYFWIVAFKQKLKKVNYQENKHEPVNISKRNNSRKRCCCL